MYERISMRMYYHQPFYVSYRLESLFRGFVSHTHYIAPDFDRGAFDRGDRGTFSLLKSSIVLQSPVIYASKSLRSSHRPKHEAKFSAISHLIARASSRLLTPRSSQLEDFKHQSNKLTSARRRRIFSS